MIVVVDTNVPVVANGASEQASPDCVQTCAERLGEIMRGEVKLVLDNRWKVISEYRQNLHASGANIGDRFLGWVLRNWTNPERCDLVSITPIGGFEDVFEEFPDDPALDGFDPADRKFIAVTCAHSESPPILQAVDSKWLNFDDAFRENGITVAFICQEDIQRLHEDN